MFDDLIPDNKAKGAADIAGGMFDDLTPKPAEPGFFPTIKRTAGQMLTTGATALEDVTGPNSLTTGARDIGQGLIDRNPAGITDVGQILSSPWLTAKEAVGQYVPQIGAAMAAGSVGARAGQAIGGLPGAAVGGLIGSLLPIATQEYGGIREDQKESGQEDKLRALAAAGIATGLERFALPVKMGGGLKLPGAATIPGAAATGFLKEGATEAAQTVVEQVGAFKDPTQAPQLAETALSGVMGGIGGGIVSGGTRAIAGKPEEAPAPAPADEVPADIAAPPQAPAEQTPEQTPADIPDIAGPPGDALREQKLPDMGPLTRSVNAGIDAEADAADAGQPIEAPVSGALAGVKPPTPEGETDQPFDAKGGSDGPNPPTPPGEQPPGPTMQASPGAGPVEGAAVFDPATKTIAPTPRATFESEQQVDQFLSTQRRAGGAKQGKALPVQREDGAWSFAREGEPEYEPVAKAKEQREAEDKRSADVAFSQVKETLPPALRTLTAGDRKSFGMDEAVRASKEPEKPDAAPEVTMAKLYGAKAAVKAADGMLTGGQRGANTTRLVQSWTTEQRAKATIDAWKKAEPDVWKEYDARQKEVKAAKLGTRVMLPDGTEGTLKRKFGVNWRVEPDEGEAQLVPPAALRVAPTPTTDDLRSATGAAVQSSYAAVQSAAETTQEQVAGGATPELAADPQLAPDGKSAPQTPQEAPAPAEALSQPETPIAPGAPESAPAPATSDGYEPFSPESGTLGIPRDEMPQIKAGDRSSLVQYLRARGVKYAEDTADAGTLKPTQAEYSPAKVEQAREFKGTDRAILVSSDGYIVDGHHQAVAKMQDEQPARVIRLEAPIAELLPMVREFPSVAAAKDAPAASVDKPADPLVDEVAETPTAQGRVRDNVNTQAQIVRGDDTPFEGAPLRADLKPGGSNYVSVDSQLEPAPPTLSPGTAPGATEAPAPGGVAPEATPVAGPLSAPAPAQSAPSTNSLEPAPAPATGTADTPAPGTREAAPPVDSTDYRLATELGVDRQLVADALYTGKYSEQQVRTLVANAGDKAAEQLAAAGELPFAKNAQGYNDQKARRAAAEALMAERAAPTAPRASPKLEDFNGDRAAYLDARLLDDLQPKKYGGRLSANRLADNQGEPGKDGYLMPRPEVDAAIARLVDSGRIVKRRGAYELGEEPATPEQQWTRMRDVDRGALASQAGVSERAANRPWATQPAAVQAKLANAMGIAPAAAPKVQQTATETAPGTAQSAPAVGEMVRFPKATINGRPAVQAGRVERVLPDGRLEVRAQEGGIFQVRLDELKPRVEQPAPAASTLAVPPTAFAPKGAEADPPAAPRDWKKATPDELADEIERLSDESNRLHAIQLKLPDGTERSQTIQQMDDANRRRNQLYQLLPDEEAAAEQDDGPYQPPDNWRESLFEARTYAKQLGIPNDGGYAGKELPDVVKMVEKAERAKAKAMGLPPPAKAKAPRLYDTPAGKQMLADEQASDSPQESSGRSDFRRGQPRKPPPELSEPSKQKWLKGYEAAQTETVDRVVADKRLAGVKVKVKAVVAETGKTASYDEDAGTAIKETRDRVTLARRLMECLNA